MIRASIVVVLAFAAACASAPPAPPPKPVGPSFEQKMGWILRLEDRRVLRDTDPAVAPPSPDLNLIGLLSDKEPRVRRRAALAIGHVALAEGVQPLMALLADT